MYVSAEKESLEDSKAKKNKKLDDLTIRARQGDNEAAKEIIKELAKDEENIKQRVVRSKMAEGTFHFCAYDMEKGKGTEHGLTLDPIHHKCGLPDSKCDCASINHT